MTRDSWYARRHAVREAYPSRADRGLPKHPDGSGLAVCSHCGGDGVIDHDHWNPQMATSAKCGQCNGSGYVDDGYRDPLLRLSYARQHRRTDSKTYAWLRQVAVKPAKRVTGSAV